MSTTLSGSLTTQLSPCLHSKGRFTTIDKVERDTSRIEPMYIRTAVRHDDVGNLVMMLELPWALAWHGVALVPMSLIWRGPIAAALGELQCEYQ